MNQESKDKQFAAFVSILSNTFLILMKLVAGVISGSISIISEAIHSMSDLLASFLAFFSVRQASIPADSDHQYGHGKFEDFSGFFEGLLIFAAAVFIVYESVEKIVSRNFHSIEPTIGIVVMGVSFLVNLIISAYIMKIGEKSDSIALVADAEHLRTDVLTSGGVMLGLVLIKFTGFNILDPIIAILVSLMIFRTSISLCRNAGANLLDSSIKKEDIEAIKDVVSEYIPDRICELKNIKTRKAGKMKLIDLTLSVPSDLTIKSGHDICDEIEEHIGNRISNVSVFIHLEPYEAKVVRSSVD